MKLKLIALCLLPLALFAQINITTSGNSIQDFNSLLNTGSVNTWNDNSTIPNYFAQRSGFGTTYQAGTGSSTVGNLYSFGSAGSTERTLGSVGSDNTSALNFAYGVLLQNNSGFNLDQLAVSYTLEQWRNAGNTTPDDVTVWYKISSSAISNLTPGTNTGWTQITALTTASPINNASTGALDGNLPANQVVLSNIAIPNLSVPNGHFIMIKWEDINHAGNDDGLGIDDVSLVWSVGCNTSSTINETSCNSYTVPSGDETYNASGTYTDTIPNAGLCDSILTINLTIQTGIDYYADTDFDGLGDINNSINTCVPPISGYVLNSNDCNDQSSAIGLGNTTYYLDADLDGFGDLNNTTLGCSLPNGYSLNGLDCNDGDFNINPNATDIPDNGIDEDCSGSDATVLGFNLGMYEFTQAAACPVTALSVTAQPTNAFFSDYATLGTTCSGSANVYSTSGWNTTSTIDLNEYNEFSISSNECFGLDLNKIVFTHRISASGGTPTYFLRSSLDNFTADLTSGASIVTDKIDTIVLPASFDVISQVTFRFYITNMGTNQATWRNDNVTLIGNINPVQPTTFFADADGDSYGNPAMTISACSVPAGYVANDADCDDSNSSINPTTVWYEDADGDNVGNVNPTFIGCVAPNNYSLVSGDCDDSDPTATFPVIYYEDNDNDGYGVSFGAEFCQNPGAGFVLNNADCDDSQNSVYPGAPEICDDFDNNCNGQTNEGLPTTVYYIDNDGDTYGQGSAGDFCSDPGIGYSLLNTDCDDDNAAAYPGATEILNNGVDENCDNTDNYMSVSETVMSNFKVQPNPSNGIFTLTFSTDVNQLNLQLLDLSGKVLNSQQLNGSNFELNYPNLSEGIYLLQISSVFETKTVRISIVK